MPIGTSSIKVNVIFSFIGKGISVLCSFLLVPLILGYLDPTRYGIWLTITSLLQWIALFDLGFGNGFRNRFVETSSTGQKELAIRYVSTAYFAMAMVSAVVILVFLFAYLFLDLSRILNAPPKIASEVNKVILAVCCLQGLKFTIDVVNILLAANHKLGIANLTAAVSSAGALIVCFLLRYFSTPSLMSVALVLMLVPIALNIIVSIFYFGMAYIEYRPRMSMVDFGLIPSILSVGGQFFIIQIVSLVLYTTANIIISNLYDPGEVTPYNIAIKYFSIITIAFNIILAPFWSRFTHEFQSKNHEWIKKSITRLIGVWAGFSALAALMLLLSSYGYSLWIGDSVHISFGLSFAVMLFSILSNWNNIFAYFLNGVSKVRLQLISGVAGCIFTIPFGLFLAQYAGMGVLGIICSTLASMTIGAVLLPIQYYKVIHGRANGIWGK